MPNLFISYRREESAGYAGRLYDRLSAHFGAESVFMDIDTLEPGIDFVEVIERAISQCDILLALIGPRWLSVADTTGQRRLDNPDDFVRLEIQAGLERDIRIIPVLVGGAEMPRSRDLPEALTKLARRNAVELSDTRWHTDVDKLIAVAENIGESQQIQEPPSPVVQELSVSGHQQNACSEEDIVSLVPRSTADLLADRQRERKAEKFSLVQDNRSICEYTRQEVDKLTPTQRERLFTADPKMAAWWRGKSPTSDAWPLFRVRGGRWVAKHQIEQIPQEHQCAIWEILPDLLEWYMQDREF